jgi:hypothetical protein
MAPSNQVQSGIDLSKLVHDAAKYQFYFQKREGNLLHGHRFRTGLPYESLWFRFSRITSESCVHLILPFIHLIVPPLAKTVDTFWLALHHTLHHMSLLERLHNFHLSRDDSFNNVPVAAGVDGHPNPKRATAMN